MKLFRKIPTIKRCSKTERAQLAPNTVDENTPAPLSITVNFQNTRKILQTFTENKRGSRGSSYRRNQKNRKQNGFQFSSVHSVVSNSLRPHGLQHARLPCPSPTLGACSNSCRWCHPTISSSVVPFSFCPQSFPASGSFQMSQLFASGGQSIGVSASTSVLPMNTQDRFPLGWTGWISWQSKGLSRVFSNTTVQKHQFFCIQLSL